MRAEIVCPQTEPETEWVRGRPLQKASPTYRHALAQRRLAAALGAWADASGSGRVGTEWRFRVSPPGEPTRPLVPDVAYLSYAALPATAAYDDVDVPDRAPTAAVEVLSPDDRDDDVASKIATYLASGTVVVLVVDPRRRIAELHDALGKVSLTGDDVVSHAALPGFTLELESLFDRPT